LRNVKTGEAVQFVEGIEYYSGSDWSEGSPNKSTTIPGVEPGKYQLLADPEADPQVDQMGYHITVHTDAPIWRNFFVCLGLLLLYPTYRFWRTKSFETARWSESDFATSGFFTFSSEDDDE
jgi:hypothetical protein